MGKKVANFFCTNYLSIIGNLVRISFFFLSLGLLRWTWTGIIYWLDHDPYVT